MTHEMGSTCSTLPQIWKDGFIHTSLVIVLVLKKIKGPAAMVEDDHQYDATTVTW